ncbi:MAG: hypothetical protein ABSF69_22715, partial [Polyangiaceae bacterium]
STHWSPLYGLSQTDESRRRFGPNPNEGGALNPTRAAGRRNGTRALVGKYVPSTLAIRFRQAIEC